MRCLLHAYAPLIRPPSRMQFFVGATDALHSVMMLWQRMATLDMSQLISLSHGQRLSRVDRVFEIAATSKQKAHATKIMPLKA